MNEKKKLVILITRGLDDERSSVARSIANGGIKSGLDVTIFLTSSAVDWVRKGAADRVHLNPFDPPMKIMIDFVRESDCQILVCPPCAEVRGYAADDLLDDVIITGSGGIPDGTLVFSTRVADGQITPTMSPDSALMQKQATSLV